MATIEPTLLHTRGDAAAGLVVPHGRQTDRLTALLTFTAVGGAALQVELTRGDVARLATDLVNILAADADTACSWWYKLQHNDDRPGTLPPDLRADPAL